MSQCKNCYLKDVIVPSNICVYASGVSFLPFVLWLHNTVLGGWIDLIVSVWAVLCTFYLVSFVFSNRFIQNFRIFKTLLVWWVHHSWKMCLCGLVFLVCIKYYTPNISFEWNIVCCQSVLRWFCMRESYKQMQTKTIPVHKMKFTKFTI